MIRSLFLAGCGGGSNGSWMKTTDDAPLALGEVVSASWWERPEAPDVLVLLTAQSVSCDARHLA